jgi:hypothetical protein
VSTKGARFNGHTLVVVVSTLPSVASHISFLQCFQALHMVGCLLALLSRFRPSRGFSCLPLTMSRAVIAIISLVVQILECPATSSMELSDFH